MKIINIISFHFGKYFLRVPLLVKKYIDYCYLKSKGVETNYGDVELYGFPIIQKHKGSRIILKKGCTLVSKSKYNIAGINHPVILATLTSTAIIEIGKSGISGASICSAKSIIIKDFCGIGANSNIYDTDFHSIDHHIRRNQNSITDCKSSEIYIDSDVWLGSNVTILKGVSIGKAAVIGAGSIVTKNVEAFSLYAGNPAKKVKKLS
jgi:acetyltransferase-like isoleucine patch superfamily enzyme